MMTLIYVAAQIPTPSVAWSERLINVIAVFVIALIAHCIALYKVCKELSNQRSLLIEGQNLKERDDIRRRLNDFFGPFKELRAESMRLYNLFALVPKSVALDGGGYFRTLVHLAEGGSFSDPDQALLDEILSVGMKQLDLIEKEGWSTANPHLTELLGRLGAHIRLLILARASKLCGMAEELREMVFPLEVDGAIETETRKLQDRYQGLLNPVAKKTAAPRLNRKQARNVAVYDKHALNYYKDTAYIDMSNEYREFRSVIPRGALILDAGCGVGRDARHFVKHGYRVVAFDASAEMVKLCREYPFTYCLHCSFQDIAFVEEFDAVWACASLVHSDEKQFLDALLRLVRSVKPDGTIYFSLKNCGEAAAQDGRTFYYYEESELNRLITDRLPLMKIKTWDNTSGLAGKNVKWTNYIYKKKLVVEHITGPNR